MKKMNIVKSSTEPDINNIWLKDGKLMAYTAQGWKALATEEGGGSGKEPVDLYIEVGEQGAAITIGKGGKSFPLEGNYPNFSASHEDIWDIVSNNKYNICITLGEVADGKVTYYGQCFPLVIGETPLGIGYLFINGQAALAKLEIVALEIQKPS